MTGGVFRRPWIRRPIRWVPAGGAAAAYLIEAEAGSFTLSGQEAELLAGYLITAEAGPFTLSGQEAELLAGYLINVYISCNL
jgi:hypothetical protein